MPNMSGESKQIDAVDYEPVSAASNKKSKTKSSLKQYLLLTGLVAGIVLVTIAGLAYTKYRAIAKAMAMGAWPEQASSVTVTTVNQRAWQPFINTTGTVVATEFITLQNEEAGTVREINIKSGQLVNPGDVLVKLDTSVEAAELRAAIARQQLAELVFDRTKRSAASNAVSANELDQAQAGLNEAVAVTQQLQSRIDRKTITAPFKATVGIVDLHPGQYLSEGTVFTSLMGIDDKVYVDFAVPQELAVRLPVGTPVMLSLVGSSDVQLPAQITSFDTQVSDRTRSTRTRATVKNVAQLRPGMSVSVKLPAGFPQQVLTVPAVSVRRAAWGDHVFVVVTDDKGAQRASQRNVKLGASLGEQVIVTSGIEQGASVIADGSFKLKDTALLTIVQPVPQPATQPATQQTTQSAAR